MASAGAPTAAELAAFARRSGIPLPASAEPIRFYSESGGPDDAMWLQFRLPAGQFQPFIKASPIPESEVLPGSDNSQMALQSFHAWLAAAPQKFGYADTQIAPGRYVRCLFDFDDPQVTVVYLMWFET